MVLVASRIKVKNNKGAARVQLQNGDDLCVGYITRRCRNGAGVITLAASMSESVKQRSGVRLSVCPVDNAATAADATRWYRVGIATRQNPVRGQRTFRSF